VLLVLAAACVGCCLCWLLLVLAAVCAACNGCCLCWLLLVLAVRRAVDVPQECDGGPETDCYNYSQSQWTAALGKFFQPWGSDAAAAVGDVYAEESKENAALAYASIHADYRLNAAAQTISHIWVVCSSTNHILPALPFAPLVL